MKRDTIRYFNIAYDSLYDGPGHRVVIFFQGCIAHCKWCHSPHSQSTRAPILYKKDKCISCRACQENCKRGVHYFINGEHILDRDKCIRCGKCIDYCPVSYKNREIGVLFLPTRESNIDIFLEHLKPHLDLVKNSGGITLSGGEALLQKDAAINILKYCKENSIDTAVETSGLLDREYYKSVSSLVDSWLFGMRITTGNSPLEHYNKIDENLEVISSSSKEILVRIPVVPKHTDDERYLNALCELMKKYGLRDISISPFNMETNHYYELSGIKANMVWPNESKVQSSERFMKSFLIEEGLNIKEITMI